MERCYPHIRQLPHRLPSTVRHVIGMLFIGALLTTASATSNAAAAKSPSPVVGDFPPPQLGPNRKGDLVDLDQRRGKVVVMTFWATWCGPCLRELPILAHMKNVIGTDALDVIAVNWGESRSDVIAFARGNSKLDLEYVFDSKGKTAALYGINSVPHMFVIDRDGRIAAIHRGYSEQALPTILQDVLDLLPDEVRTRPPANAAVN